MHIYVQFSDHYILAQVPNLRPEAWSLSAAEGLANEIADAALKVIGGTGHMSPMEDAASWSSAVTTLWRE